MRNLRHAAIAPAPAGPPGVVCLVLRTAGTAVSVPVTAGDLREIREVTGGTHPAWQAVRDTGAVVNS